MCRYFFEQFLLFILLPHYIYRSFGSINYQNSFLFKPAIFETQWSEITLIRGNGRHRRVKLPTKKMIHSPNFCSTLTLTGKR